MENYQLLKDEIINVILLAVIGALGVVSQSFEKYVKKLEIDARVEIWQKRTLQGTARLLKEVLSLCT